MATIMSDRQCVYLLFSIQYLSPAIKIVAYPMGKIFYSGWLVDEEGCDPGMQQTARSFIRPRCSKIKRPLGQPLSRKEVSLFLCWLQ